MACPECRQAPGEPCIGSRGQQRTANHAGRQLQAAHELRRQAGASTYRHLSTRLELPQAPDAHTVATGLAAARAALRGA